MEHLIDLMVSSSWVWLIVALVLLGGAGASYFFRPFKKKGLNNILPVALTIFFFGGMLWLTRGEYGVAVEFIDAESNGKDLALIERHEIGDGDGGSSTVYRLYTLSLETGERKLRKLSNAEIVSMTDHSVIINEFQRFVEYDLNSGDEKREWSAEKGFEKFPELSSGIASLQQFKNDEQNFFKVVAQNGHEYFFDPLADSLFSGRPRQTTNNQIRFTSSGIYHYLRDDYYSISFNRKNGEIDELISQSQQRGEKKYDGEFLEPEIIVCDFEKKFFIIKHHETLKLTQAIFTAISFDLERRWEIKQSSLNVSDDYNPETKAGVSCAVNDHLVITFGGFVVCLNANDGSVRWKNRQ